AWWRWPRRRRDRGPDASGAGEREGVRIPRRRHDGRHREMHGVSDGRGELPGDERRLQGVLPDGAASPYDGCRGRSRGSRCAARDRVHCGSEKIGRREAETAETAAGCWLLVLAAGGDKTLRMLPLAWRAPR